MAQRWQPMGVPVAPCTTMASHSFPTPAGVRMATPTHGLQPLPGTGQLPSSGGETEAVPWDVPRCHLQMVWRWRQGWAPTSGVAPAVTSPSPLLPTGVLPQERAWPPPPCQGPDATAAAGQGPGWRWEGAGGGATAPRSAMEGWQSWGQLNDAPSPSPHTSPRCQPPSLPPAAWHHRGLWGFLGGHTAPCRWFLPGASPGPAL